MDPSASDLLGSIRDLIAAINRVDDTIRQIAGLLIIPGQRPVIQPASPVMPNLTANQWPMRNGDGFPKPGGL
jgi:hypothetical protein